MKLFKPKYRIKQIGEYKFIPQFRKSCIHKWEGLRIDTIDDKIVTFINDYYQECHCVYASEKLAKEVIDLHKEKSEKYPQYHAVN